MTTIGETISRVRNIIKAVTMDAFITDRVIYSLIQKYAKMYIKRQDGIATRAKFGSLFRKLPCMELIEVDKVEACCNVSSGCKIMRTREKLPGVMEGVQGPLLRSVSSVDNSIEVYRTTPVLYTSMSKTTAFKYNKNKYYWFMDGYIYIPSIEWDSVSIEGIFDSDLSGYTCDDACMAIQDQPINIPPELFAEIEQQVINDFMKSAQIPQDSFIADKQNILR
jgi:hypothetical protein